MYRWLGCYCSCCCCSNGVIYRRLEISYVWNYSFFLLFFLHFNDTYFFFKVSWIGGCDDCTMLWKNLTRRMIFTNQKITVVMRSSSTSIWAAHFFSSISILNIEKFYTSCKFFCRQNKSQHLLWLSVEPIFIHYS